MRRGLRSGNVLLLVIILCVVAFMAISTLFTVVSEESAQTGNLVKEIKATYVGESVCSHIVSLVNRRPYEERFFLRFAKLAFSSSGGDPSPVWTFDQSNFPFEGGMPADWGDDVEYAGTVKDLDPYQRTYRVYLEVVCLDHKVTFSFDKRYEEDFLGALNNEATDLNKELDEGLPDQGKTDDQLDKIREEAGDPTKIVAGASAAELKKLHADKAAYTSPIGLSPDLMPDTSKPNPGAYTVQ